jgi:hypothetical protein
VRAPLRLAVEAAQALDDLVGFEGFDAWHEAILYGQTGRRGGATSPSLPRVPLLARRGTVDVETLVEQQGVAMPWA